jgi:hypothetical protein
MLTFPPTRLCTFCVITTGGILRTHAAAGFWQTGNIPLRRQTHSIEPPLRLDPNVTICEGKEKQHAPVKIR